MAAAVDELIAFIRACKPKRLRSLCDFAAEEIWLPDGPAKGHRFTFDRQPYARPLLEELGSWKWRRCAFLGPVQSGKTLLTFVIPILYCLFELKETTIAGVPEMETAGDKYREDIEPALNASRFADQVPTRGPGSRGGGKVEAIKYRNGATLKYMSGMGKDHKRSGFTARYAFVTEADKFDKAQEASRESDPITQIANRTSAYDTSGGGYASIECTVSIEEGKIWQEWTNGTQSDLWCKCIHCGEYVHPGREHLVGWEEAATEEEARRNALFCCPACGAVITERERQEMNQSVKLVHRGQTIDRDGVVHGDPPETNTLGFRWTAFNNLLYSAGEIGAEEWAAKISDDPDNAEKALRQFRWVIPAAPPKLDLVPLKMKDVADRSDAYQKGVIPEGTDYLGVGIDVGMYRCYWTLTAFNETIRTRHIADYDTFEVLPPSSRSTMSEDERIGSLQTVLLERLLLFWKRCGSGWEVKGGGTMVPSLILCDAGYMTDIVKRFAKEVFQATESWIVLPSYGRGVGQLAKRGQYVKPKKVGGVVVKIGEEWHIHYMKSDRVFVAEDNCDHWKSDLHLGMKVTPGGPGAITLFDDLKTGHKTFSRHVTSEKQVLENVPGKGEVIRWDPSGSPNHYLDSTYQSLIAGSALGFTILEPAETEEAEAETTVNIQTPDGRQFLATDR